MSQTKIKSISSCLKFNIVLLEFEELVLQYFITKNEKLIEAVYVE